MPKAEGGIRARDVGRAPLCPYGTSPPAVAGGEGRTAAVAGGEGSPARAGGRGKITPMTTQSQPLIDAIIEHSDDRRAQRFLDDLRQEGVLPGRRNRIAFRLRRARQTIAGWVSPLDEYRRDLTTGRKPASHWVQRMDELVAQGQTSEDAARQVGWEMGWEDSSQRMRWFGWSMIAFFSGFWVVMGLMFAGVIG